MHGSQNMNHIRLIEKLIYVQAKFKYLLHLMRHTPPKRALASQPNIAASCQRTKKATKQRPKHLYRPRAAQNAHKSSLPSKASLPLLSKTQKQKLSHMRKAFPIVSNMPFIHLNSSLILVNTSPFALTDPRFGILHHHAPSISYY